MTDLRVGVVGLGARGGLAGLAHRPGQGSAVVAACDPMADRRERAAASYGSDVALVDDYRALLQAGLDAVFVLTPDHTHAEVATDFLRAGVAVYLEKPLAITTADCDLVLRTARMTGTRLYVGHNMRHMPVVRLMRDVVARGDIGQVKTVWCRHFVGHGGDFYFKDWHADRRKVTSLLLQKGAHDLDVIHWLSGGYSTRVSAFGDLMVYGDIADRADRTGQLMLDWFDPQNNWPPGSLRGLNPVVDVEDVSLVNLALDNGVLATYQQCHFAPDYWRNYTVIGTEGRLENFGDSEGAVVKIWKRRSGYRPDADHELSVPPGTGGHGGADLSIVDEFLRFVRDGGQTETSPVAARHAVAAGVAATESLRDGGRPVDIPTIPAGLADYFERGQSAVRHASGEVRPDPHRQPARTQAS